jgi:drug/metabolite transporter (DMT)-like permease
MDSDMLKAYLALLLTVFIFGTTFAVIKIGLFDVQPLTLAFARFLVAAVVFALVFAVKKRFSEFVGVLRSEWKTFALLGLVGIALNYAFENVAVLYTTTSQAALLLTSDVVFISVLAFFFLKERLKKKNVFGVLLGLVGVSIILFPDFSVFGPEIFFGNVLALIASLCWATYSVLIKKASKKFDPLTVTAGAIFFGTIFLFFAALFFEGPNLIPVSSAGIFSVFYLAILSSVVAYYLWAFGLSKIDASKAGVFIMLMPVVSTAIGGMAFQRTNHAQHPRRRPLDFCRNIFC